MWLLSIFSLGLSSLSFTLSVFCKLALPLRSLSVTISTSRNHSCSLSLSTCRSLSLSLFLSLSGSLALPLCVCLHRSFSLLFSFLAISHSRALSLRLSLPHSIFSFFLSSFISPYVCLFFSFFCFDLVEKDRSTRRAKQEQRRKKNKHIDR